MHQFLLEEVQEADKRAANKGVVGESFKGEDSAAPSAKLISGNAVASALAVATKAVPGTAVRAVATAGATPGAPTAVVRAVATAGATPGAPTAAAVAVATKAV